MTRKVARKKTALAVGAVAACVLPGALAGSSAPPKFPTDCIKQATLGKCLAGDKLFGDTPDQDAVEGIKGLLSEPLMIGRDDVHSEPTLGGGIKKFVRRAAGKPSAAVKKAVTGAKFDGFLKPRRYHAYATESCAPAMVVAKLVVEQKYRIPSL